MKKYTLILSVLVLLGLNFNTASASNCAPGDLFNSNTGQPCTGVSSGSGSSEDGGSAVSTFNAIYKSSFKVGTRGNDVKVLQQFLKDEGYYFGKVDGKYGKITARAVNDFREDNDISVISPKVPVTDPVILPCSNPVSNMVNCLPDPYLSLTPVISGVSGPQSLSVNVEGTWTVKAYDPSGGNLSYSVIWGDEMEKNLSYNALGQSATFTHSYSQAGNYTPVFYVTNSSGQSAKTSLSVGVGGVTSSLTLLSPNGGETWVKGTTQNIKWSSIYSHGDSQYDIKLSPYYPPCTSQICPAYAYRAPYIITKGVYGSSYTWSVGQTLRDVYTNSVDSLVSDGAYTIEVCQTGTSICDSSDSYFKITAGTTPSSITVLSPNGGETWVKGTTQTIKWRDNTTYPVCPSGAYCMSPAPKYYDIVLNGNSTCSGEVCTMGFPVYTIANGVYGTSYDWSVGKSSDVYSNTIPDGAYRIQVCQTGTSICDSSDSYLKITTSESKLMVSAKKGGARRYQSGVKNVIIGEFNFKAPASNSVVVTGIGFLDNVYSNGNYDPEIVSKDFRNISVWDGSTMIAPPISEISAKPVGTTQGSFNYENSNFTVSAGGTKTITIKADISESAQSGSHIIQLGTFGFTGAATSNWGDLNDNAESVKDSAVNIVSTPSIFLGHSADTNKDWKIDDSELSSFLTLYEYRSGTVRTGEYSKGTGMHGDVYFVPGPGQQTGANHSADSNKDWRISLLELTRVIEFKNSAGYRVQAGTEDGFAPL